MNKENKDHSKTTEDGWNRAFFGSPTIGGFVVIGTIIAFILYNIILT
jgi:hypothetical protein